MDTRDDDAGGRRDGAGADRRGDPDRERSDARPRDRPGGTTNSDADSAADADTDAESDEVGLAEAFETDGDRPPLGPLEPGSPNPENVLFVVLGALATVALFATAF